MGGLGAALRCFYAAGDRKCQTPRLLSGFSARNELLALPSLPRFARRRAKLRCKSPSARCEGFSIPRKTVLESRNFDVGRDLEVALE